MKKCVGGKIVIDCRSKEEQFIAPIARRQKPKRIRFLFKRFDYNENGSREKLPDALLNQSSDQMAAWSHSAGHALITFIKSSLFSISGTGSSQFLYSAVCRRRFIVFSEIYSAASAGFPILLMRLKLICLESHCARLAYVCAVIVKFN